MKILIDARNLGAKPSGVGMYAYNWIKALEKEDDIDLHVIADVIESEQIKELDQNSRVSIHSYGRQSNKNASVFKYFRYVQKIIIEQKPDIFWEVNNLIPIKIKNPYGKFIVTIHDMFPLTMPECFGKIYPYYFKYGIKKTLNNVDGILYDSEYSKNETESFFRSAKTKKSFISYVIIPQIPLMDVEEKDYFLYIGNLEKRKGVDILLDAYEAYVKQGGKRELKLVGKIREDDIGVKIDNLKQSISSFRYMGYVDNETRTRLYRECGCFVFPSRAEGFGMPIIEALQCGKPVIASDLPIFKELMGENCQYFTLKNDKNDINELCDKMLSIDETKIDSVELVKGSERYCETTLSPKLIEFLSELL